MRFQSVPPGFPGGTFFVSFLGCMPRIKSDVAGYCIDWMKDSLEGGLMNTATLAIAFFGMTLEIIPICVIAGGLGFLMTLFKVPPYRCGVIAVTLAVGLMFYFAAASIASLMTSVLSKPTPVSMTFWPVFNGHVLAGAIALVVIQIRYHNYRYGKNNIIKHETHQLTMFVMTFFSTLVPANIWVFYINYFPEF